MKILNIFLITLLLFCVSINAQCSFIDEEGKSYDVDRFGGKIQQVNATDGSGIMFNIFLCSANSVAPCSQASPVCLVRPEGTTYNCGKPNLSPWKTTVPYGSGIVANFYNGSTCSNGVPRSATINLICDQSVSEYQAIAAVLTTNCNFRFDIRSCGGCPGGCSSSNPNGSGLDIGWILIIVSGSIFILYFIVGAIVKYKYFNAEGTDLIVNKGFWFELPILIKEGTVYSYRQIAGASGYSKFWIFISYEPNHA